MSVQQETYLDPNADEFIEDVDDIYKPKFITHHDGTDRGTINHELSKDFSNLDAPNLPYGETTADNISWRQKVNAQLQGLGIIPQASNPKIVNPRSSLDEILSYMPHAPNLFKSIIGNLWVWVTGGIVVFILTFFPAIWYGSKKEKEKKQEMTFQESMESLKFKSLPPLPDLDNK